MSASSLLLLTSILAPADPSDAAKKAQDDLQGTWVAVALEEKGKKLTPEEVRKENFSITIMGNELVMRQGTGTPVRFSFTLDPGKKPAHIDLRQLGEKARPGVVHAIYLLENGELKICFGGHPTPNKPEERPQEFATAKEDKESPAKGKVMFTVKRSEKELPDQTPRRTGRPGVVRLSRTCRTVDSSST
jgi:uncharacterized protein (TIGR03067 family)